MTRKNEKSLIANNSETLSNGEILKIYIENGLIERCLSFQFAKLKEPWKMQYSGDMLDDLIVIIAEYPNDKLNNVHRNKHMNAWLTRVLQNNLMSKSSKFYHQYLRFNLQTNDLDEVMTETDE